MTLEALNRHADLVRELEELQAAYNELEARAMKHSRLDGQPHGNGTTRPCEVIGIALAEISQRIDEQKARIARSETEIERYISAIHDPQLALAFRLRFVCGLPLKEIPDYVPKYLTVDALKAALYAYVQRHSAESYSP